MMTPTPARIREAMDRLELCVKRAEGAAICNMGHWDISRGPTMTSHDAGNEPEYVCGTAACHGGWYALATLGQVKWAKPPVDDPQQQDASSRDDESAEYLYHDDEMPMPRMVGFSRGAERLARDLLGEGAHPIDLTSWAGLNPDLWGNVYGEAMFEGGCRGRAAFDRGGDYTFPVEVVIDHWRAVADRIEDAMAEDAFDPENIYGQASIRQSIEEDRR